MQRLRLLASRNLLNLFTRQLKQQAFYKSPEFTRLPIADLELGYMPTLARRKFLPGSFDGGFPKYLSGPRETFPAGFRVPDNDIRPSTLEEWAAVCRSFIDEELDKHVVLLLRGLPLVTVDDFSSFVRHLQYRPFNMGVNGYRSSITDNVFTASDDPSSLNMELHNEISYADYFPRKVILFCVQEPADKCGGETPVAINREIMRRLDSKVLDKLEKKKIRYQAFLAHEGKDADMVKTWRERFQTTDRKVVEDILQSQGWDFAWDEQGNLRYWYVHPAFLTHPETGEKIFFNQLTSTHPSYFRDHPKFVGKDIPDDQCVFSSYYGDGTPFEPAVLQHIRNTYWTCAVTFRWRTGDVAVVDNLQALHGRMSWIGKRRLVTSLTED